MIIRGVQKFFGSDIAGGAFLGLAVLIALGVSNSPLQGFYTQFLHDPLSFKTGPFTMEAPFLLWINDGFMAIFFLLVGLELKREIMVGHLSQRAQLILPGIAAVGGLVMPVVFYTLINGHNPDAMQGWAIPAATDIAFALGVMRLLGARVPNSLVICLLSIAIIDDLIVVAIIALFYTTHLSILSLCLAGVCLGVLYLLNRKGVSCLRYYIITGIILWACVLKSGVHATLAGVALAGFIPLTLPIGAPSIKQTSPLKRLEHTLHPWVAFCILPLFAFANSGLDLRGFSTEMLLAPITLGISLGLFLGKPIGIIGVTMLAVAMKICTLPKNVGWYEYAGMAVICGIGFTMSFFIGTLAFHNATHQDSVRMGVLFGSALAGICGYTLLRLSPRTCQAGE